MISKYKYHSTSYKI